MICAVFFGNGKKTGIDMVLGKAVNKMYVKWRKSLIKDSTDAAAEKPEMVQGTVRGEKEAIERWLMKYEFVCI